MREDHPDVEGEGIRRLSDQLNERLKEYALELDVVPGAEVAMDSAREMSDEELRSVTLARNGHDLLIETPYGPLPPDFEGSLEELGRRGFRVILAHPEHNPTFQECPERLARLAHGGVLVQLTAGSLVGLRPLSGSSRLARIAVDRGWAHVVASDAHSAQWRPPDLRPGLGAALRRWPEAAAELHWMVTDVPRAILDGAPLPARPARDAPRRFRRLRR